MAVALLTALGYSDLHQEGRPLSPFREHSQRLLAEVEESPTLAQGLSLPILGPIIRHLAARFGRVDYLLILGTDQSPPNPGDTVFAAQLIARLHRLGHPDLQCVGAVAWAVVQSDPSNFDLMFSRVPGALRDAAAALPSGTPGDVHEAYVNASSGTPACRVAMLLLASRVPFLRDARVRFLYVPRGERRATSLDVGWLVQRERLEELAQNLLAQCQYGALAQVLEKLAPAHPVTAVLRAMDHRLSWRFRHALDCLDGAAHVGAGLDEGLAGLVRRLRGALAAALQGDELRRRGEVRLLDREPVRALIREVALTLRARRVMGDAQGYLTTLSTLVEQVLRMGAQHMADPGSWPQGHLGQSRPADILAALPSGVQDRVRHLERERVDRLFWEQVLQAGSAVLRDGRLDRIRRWSHALAPVVRQRNSLVHDLGATALEEIETEFRRSQQGRYRTIDEFNHQFFREVFGIPLPPLHDHPYAGEHQQILAAIREMAAP